MASCDPLDIWSSRFDNISAYYSYDHPPATHIPSNPDIAGVGVLIAFVASAYMTLILVLAYYGSGCIDEAHHNPIDRGFLRVIRAVFKLKSGTSEVWEESIRRAVLMFSDQQLVTGLAILGSGLSQLHKGITAYHWQIIVYLAWFSSLTHLTLLTVLRDYFRGHSGIRNWRLVLMSVTLALLIAALVPTGATGWMKNTNQGFLGVLPASCFLKRLSKSGSFDVNSVSGLSMVLSIVILVFGYVTRAIKLSAKASATAQWCLSATIGRFLRVLLDNILTWTHTAKIKFPWICIYVSVFTVYVSLRMLRDFYTSVVGEILWLTLALIWGSLHLFFTRVALKRPQGYYTSEIILPQEDNIWSFGQCIAIILLTFPIISMGEAYLESRRMGAEPQDSPLKRAITANSTFSQRTRKSLGPTRRPLICLGVTRLSSADRLDLISHNTKSTTLPSYSSTSKPDSIVPLSSDSKTHTYRCTTDAVGTSRRGTWTAVDAPHHWDLHYFEWYRMLIAQTFISFTGVICVFLSTVASVDLGTLVNLLIAVAVGTLTMLFWIFVSALAQIVPMMRLDREYMKKPRSGNSKRMSIRIGMYFLYLGALAGTAVSALFFVYSARWTNQGL